MCYKDSDMTDAYTLHYASPRIPPGCSMARGMEVLLVVLFLSVGQACLWLISVSSCTMVLALLTPALPPPLLHFCLAPELSKILVEWQAGFLNRRYLPDLSLFGTRVGEVWMDRVMRTDELIEIDVHTRVRVPLSLSLSLAPYYLPSGFLATSRAVPWHCFLCWSAE